MKLLKAFLAWCRDRIVLVIREPEEPEAVAREVPETEKEVQVIIAVKGEF